MNMDDSKCLGTNLAPFQWNKNRPCVGMLKEMIAMIEESEQGRIDYGQIVVTSPWWHLKKYDKFFREPPWWFRETQIGDFWLN